MKNFFTNFKYMSYEELRIFWVILSGVLLVISFFTLNILDTNQQNTTTKIALVNKETSKLLDPNTKTTTVKQEMLDDTKVKSALSTDTPIKQLNDDLKSIYTYSNGEALLKTYSSKKDLITGTVWNTIAGGSSTPTFMTADWQSKAKSNNWSGSIISEYVVPNTNGTYDILVTITQDGNNTDSTTSGTTYSLTATKTDKGFKIDSNGILDGE